MLLHVIWQIQTDRSSGAATLEAIRLKSELSASDINGYLHDLRQISKSYYVRTIRKIRPAWYRLPSEHIVTQSDTAKILLELFEFPNNECLDGQVPQARFIIYAAKKLGLATEIIDDRLEKAIKQCYLTRIQRDEWYLELGDRLVCEKEYLTLLAQHLELKLP